MTAAVDDRALAQARVGSVLKDKWRLDALLGIGGMAVVYSATHRNQKRVAIKMLLPELANVADVRDRFVREGYAANTIEHPGALSVLDDDVTEEGLPFLIMELLDGETVDAYWMRQGQRLEVAEVLMIGAAVLDVLASAHAKGVVHRDIKPENLFLVRGGGLKVLDFGIARVAQEAQTGGTQTRVGTVMGTPAFMAPEQALAKWGEVDGRTDLWAVGATMFTLVSGSHVHEGATGNEQFVKSATQPARSVASCTTGLPRSVVALIDRALRFDRAARWPDARAMQEAARGAYEALTGLPLVIEAPTSGPRSSLGGTPSSAGLNVSVSGATVPSAPGARPASARTSSGSFPGHASAGAIARGPTLPGGAAPAPMQGRTSSGSFVGPRGGSPSTGGMPPVRDATLVATRTAEREAALAEVARYQPVVAEVQGRLAGVRRRLAQVQEQIAGVRKERASGDELFRRQMNARLEGVGEARKGYRAAMGEVARIALDDAAHFPHDVGATERAAIEKTASAVAVRSRESALHRAALSSFDLQTVKRGVLLAAVGTVLFLLLFFSPVIVRSCASDTGTMAPPDTTTAP